MKPRMLALLALLVVVGLLPLAASAQQTPTPQTRQLFAFADPARDYYDPQNVTDFSSTDILSVRGYYSTWPGGESITFSIQLANNTQPGDQYIIYIDTDGNPGTGFPVFFSLNQSGYEQIIVYSKDYVFCCVNGTQYCEVDRIFYQNLSGDDLGQVRFASGVGEVVIEVDIHGFDPKKANYFFETDVNYAACPSNETHFYSDGAGIYLTSPGQQSTPSIGLPTAVAAMAAALALALRGKAR